jgi:uncharacterized protein YndB with AHSA1/START domain
MRLLDSVIIAAEAMEVWAFVADPALQKKWNPKIVEVMRERKGAVELGEKFEMVYRMSGQENHTRVEVTAADEGERVVFLHRSIWKSVERIVEEEYAITAHGAGVKVVQTIDFSRAGVPWLLRVVIWVITRFGTKVEKPYLWRLRELVDDPGKAMVREDGEGAGT